MDLVIRNSFGHKLAVQKNITIAPFVGSTVTVECGSFDAEEVHFDYKENEINMYSDYWSIFDNFQGTTNEFGTFLESNDC